MVKVGSSPTEQDKQSKGFESLNPKLASPLSAPARRNRKARRGLGKGSTRATLPRSSPSHGPAGHNKYSMNHRKETRVHICLSREAPVGEGKAVLYRVGALVGGEQVYECPYCGQLFTESWIEDHGGDIIRKKGK